MASWQAHLVSLILRKTLKPRLARATEAIHARRLLESGVSHRVPRELDIVADTVAGVPGEWTIRPDVPPRATLLLLHGGGYFACSARTHRPYTCFFAARGFRVFTPNYRLAPEHPFPAAIDDAQGVYLSIAESLGGAGNFVVAGDSAGGGLALALLLRLREGGHQLPAASALFSPWTDLATTGASAIENEARCSMFVRDGMQRGAENYLAGADPRHPHASPLYADLRGLPPMLVHAAQDEMMRDDATRLVERARAAGVDVQSRLWPVVHHDWQLFQPFIPEARESLNLATAFLMEKATLVAPTAAASKAPEATRASDAGDVPDAAVAIDASKAPAAADADVEVCIIGSGFSGLGMAIQLQRAGIDSFEVLEQADAIGGTWRDNTYPGCACDIPSHLYSLSFAPKADWTRMYPTQPEIRAYLHECVERFGLGARIKVATRVDEARFDDASGLWTVRATSTAACGAPKTRQLRARFVVSAIGGLSRPSIPSLPGAASFAGPAFHSARWNHDIDLRGKHVAVIGTGASAIQFVPEIASKVASLSLFQRTAPWVLPKLDRPIGAREQWALEHVPLYRTAWRWSLYWRQEMLALAFTSKVELLDRAKRMGLRMLKRQVADAGLRARLTPDYVPGCKRILISNDYYRALCRDNVNVVTDRIATVTPVGVITQGEGATAQPELHRADVLIYATGFHASDPIGSLRVYGRDGIALDEAWRDGMHAYLGITVPRFPNFFMLSGPNTGLGHNSVIFMFEAQMRYVLDCIKTMRRDGLRTLEVRPHVEADYNDDVQRRLRKTVWATGCKSWYLDSRGRNVSLWPGFTVDYWRRLRRIDWRAYRTEAASPHRQR